MSKAWIQNVNVFADLEICYSNSPGGANSNNRKILSDENTVLLMVDPVSETVSLTKTEKHYKYIAIYDITGKQITVSQNENENLLSFNISQLQQRIYFIHTQNDDDEIVMKKFIKNW